MLLSPSTSVVASRRRCAFSRRRTLRASALLRVREDARELVSWKQTPTELLVRVRLGGPLSGVPRAGVACKITPKRLRLSVGAGEPVLVRRRMSALFAAHSVSPASRGARRTARLRRA